ncbi:hypothetical protein K437DRAFT_272483 [Tilletiaria anomala UBC 951]|uniref:Glycosyl transferase family 3 domain-containing protein n=1 Tax=Tilletiaria anomala (strain ATCC 24038 / CBS 436.72 / UBC 951) TaxID=1037660 RepID=A0A066WIT3_TILAU|nr:uncharacterized protein K437DRAFT_272483 [Tilletiaria anomala UBC 951]KDN52453.1 hypothetical protein K437DRAFT_272483 [Tilletiaria anomala UBC 951]
MAATSSIAPPLVKGSNAGASAPHTSDTFRPLLKKLTLSCPLPPASPSEVASSSSLSSAHSPSQTHPPGPPLTPADLLALFEHMADANFTSSHANHAQIGAALTALRMSGIDREPAALAIASKVFLQCCLRVPQRAVQGDDQSDGRGGGGGGDGKEYTGLLDIVGTGGDGQDTFNVSTTAAIVASGVPGIRVCKHGAKASSSTSGSVDLLLSLGIPLSRLPPTSLPDILPASSFAFLYAQLFHPSLAPLAPIRRALSFPTLFNVLGPLINPALPRRCVLGVHSYGLGRTFAEALQRRGDVQRAWVVCGREGLDEISCAGETDVWELSERGEITQRVVTPEDFGLQRHPLSHVGSFSSDENAAIVWRLLSSTTDEDLPLEPLASPSRLRTHELPTLLSTSSSLSSSFSSIASIPTTPTAPSTPTGTSSLPPIPANTHLRAIADYTLMQAAALIYVAGRAPTLPACVHLARTAMQDGSAKAALERFEQCANREIARSDEQARRRAEEAQANATLNASAAEGDAKEREEKPEKMQGSDTRKSRQRLRQREKTDDRNQLQDGFAYLPEPSRDANVGTDD